MQHGKPHDADGHEAGGAMDVQPEAREGLARV
jgi:hypothetical protein